jgi:hypothetical protein
VSVRVGALPLRVGVRRLRPRLRRLRRVGALLQLGRDALQRLVGRLELGRLLLQLQGGRLGLQTRRVLGRREPRRLDRGPRALGHVARERHLGVGSTARGAGRVEQQGATHAPRGGAAGARRRPPLRPVHGGVEGRGARVRRRVRDHGGAARARVVADVRAERRDRERRPRAAGAPRRRTPSRRSS